MKQMHGLLPTDRAAPPQKSPMRSISTDHGLGKSPARPSQPQPSTSVSYDSHLESLGQEKGALEAKITQLQTYLKQWQQECETMDKKHFKLEGALNEVIYYVEVMAECSVLKQSIKELKILFKQNENQLKQFLELRKDPKLALAERPELDAKIRNLLEGNRKNKEIEDGFINNLRINDQELSVLKTRILKTFEDQLALILCSEVKELQLKKENIVQKMTSINLSQELASKMSLVGELENTCKKLLDELELERQEKNDLQQKVNKLQRSRNFKSGEIKPEPEKPILLKKPVQYFSTPKAMSKVHNANVKTVDPKAQQANPVSTVNPTSAFRVLKKDFSPKPKAGSFVQTITSPMTVVKGPRFSNKDVFNSKESTKQKSPIPPVYLTTEVNEFKKSFSTFRSDDKLLGSPNVTRQRYSDIHEMARNKTTVAQIKLADLRTQNSEETATSKSGKAKSMNLADVPVTVNHFLSNDDFGSIDSVQTIEPANEKTAFDLLGSKDVANKVNPVISVVRQSSSYKRSSEFMKIEENLIPGEQFGFSAKGNNTSIRIGGGSNESQLASLGLGLNKLGILARSIDEDLRELQNSKENLNPLKRGSLNLENIGKSSSKKSYGERNISMRESDSCVIYHNYSSTKKKTPPKDVLRDITNTYSSQKKGGFYQSRQTSLVKCEYETSVKKRNLLNPGFYLSSGKNPVLSECEEMRTSLLESPAPQGGIVKNFKF